MCTEILISRPSMNSAIPASQVLTQIINTLNKMIGEADDRLSHMAGEETEEAQKIVLALAIDHLEKEMKQLHDQLYLGFQLVAHT